MVEHSRVTDEEVHQELMELCGFDRELDISLHRRSEDGQWRATCDGETCWGDTPADALDSIAAGLCSE